MAEAVFRDRIKMEQLESKIEVDSAGTGKWHVGEQPHQGTKDLLEQRNISYDGILARQVHKKGLGKIRLYH